MERSDTVRISGQAARELHIGKVCAVEPEMHIGRVCAVEPEMHIGRVCAVEPEILTVSLRSTSGWGSEWPLLTNPRRRPTLPL